MRFKTLGKSAVSVSVVGLGTWPLGGGYDWGPVDEAQAVYTIHAALAQEINLIDTAPVYGNGLSETLLARALTGKRLQVILASKCGLVKNGSWAVHDLRPTSIRAQLEGSLSRLKTDFLDIYFIHYPDPNVPWEEAVGELSRLQEEGKIRYIGLCNVSVLQIKQALKVAEIACVQNEYSLVHPLKGQEVFSCCREHQISFMGYGTLCGGMLSGKYVREPNFRRADARNYFYKTGRGAAFEEALQLASRVKKISAQKKVPPVALAGAWALRQADFVLCGAKTAKQVEQNAQAAKVILSPEEMAFLEQTNERS